MPKSRSELRRLGEPIPRDEQDARILALDAKRRRYGEEIRRLADVLGGPGGVIEDGVYRFYYQSIEIATLYTTAQAAYDLLNRLCPDGCRIHGWFEEIAAAARHAWTSPADLKARNAGWTTYARPVVEFAFHCEYFLRQLVRFEGEEFAPMTLLPSGVAALLCLYGVR